MEENYKKSIFATFSRKNFFGNPANINNFEKLTQLSKFLQL